MTPRVSIAAWLFSGAVVSDFEMADAIGTGHGPI